jgi:glycosyltransferase involved in cell wall biosynthesis
MPEREAARAVLERLRGSGKRRVLFVSHGERGGVARHIEGLARCLASELEVLVLQPEPAAHVALRWRGQGESRALFFDAKREWEALVAVLAAIRIDRIHFHHVHGLPQSVLELPARLACAHDVTLHDYFPACPGYHLVDASGRYCAADPACLRCTDRHAAQWPLSIEQWRNAFASLLRDAARVIAPSEDSARRIAAFFPGVASVVWPHPEEAPRPARACARVLVPGAISTAKGIDVLEACVADALARGLPLHFRVLGFVGRPLPLWPQAPLSVRGEYPEGRLEELIAVEGGDVILFASQCPETFSYTLSAALDSGLPIVATALGAFTERLAGLPNARLVAWDADAAQINDALVAMAAPAAAQAPSRPRTSFERYRDLYLSGWPAPSESAAHDLPAIDSAWCSPPTPPQERLPLAYLFEDGVLCGKAKSLEGLRRYAFDPDSLYADADARVRELIEAADAQRRNLDGVRPAAATRHGDLAARAAAAEEHLRRIERSRSWRMTAPLRAIVRWLRRSH